MPPIIRSFGAVVLGYMAMMIVVIVLTLIFVKSMGQHSGHPTTGYLVANVVYSFLAAAFGGWVTARIAPSKPVEHAVALGLLIFVFGLISYRHYTGLQPVWYQWLMILALPLCAIAAAALYAGRQSLLPKA